MHQRCLRRSGETGLFRLTLQFADIAGARIVRQVTDVRRQVEYADANDVLVDPLTFLRGDFLIEPDNLALLGNFSLQLKSQSFDICNRCQAAGARHLAAQFDQEPFTIRELKVRQ